MATVHEEFDEAYWTKRYPLAELREKAREFVLARAKELPGDYENEAAVERHIRIMMPKWGRVSTPKQIAANIQLRWEAWPGDPPDGATPADIFAWCQGEAVRRDTTKIGGLPYWPKSRTWPEGDGLMYFLGQLNFAESFDIVGQLPGHVLVIFLKNNRNDYQTSDQFHFEWVTVGDDELVEELPCQGWWSRWPVFGQRHRSWDHPELGIWEGTKIGGLPEEIQESPNLPGFHLASLQSLGFDIGEPDPLVNRTEPLTWDDSRKYWTFGDVGTLYLFADADGGIHAEDTCY